MKLYVIAKNRYYYQSCVNVGPKRYWNFTDRAYMATMYETKEEAIIMRDKIEQTYTGILDNYKGKFRVRVYELQEVK